MDRPYSAVLYPEHVKDLLMLLEYVNADQAAANSPTAAARRLAEHLKNWELAAALDAGKLADAAREMLHRFLFDEGDYDVDDVPPVSAGADGCHVAAWIWIPLDEDAIEQ